MASDEPIDSDESMVELFDRAFGLEEQSQHKRALELRRQFLEFYPESERAIIAFARRHRETGGSRASAERTDDAFIEMKRFQSISHSDDYDGSVETIGRDADSE